MAQNVSAEFRRVDFADFPNVAPFMKESVIPEERWEGLRRYLRGESVEGDEEICKNVVPPR